MGLCSVFIALKFLGKSREKALSIGQSQSKETGSVQKDHCVQIETPLILYGGGC